MFFHMSIFKLVHISILMYLIQRESLPKTALYKRQRTAPPPSPVVTLSSQTTFNQSSLKNNLALKKKQNNKRRNYDIVLLIHGVVNIPVPQVPSRRGAELDCKQLNGEP